jgi:hypothetical protein
MRRLIPVLLAVLVSPATFVMADARPFTFTYDTYPVGKGNWEYEQWITYRGRSQADHGFTRFDFRHEVEFGLADNFDLSIYFASWRYEDSDSRQGTKFDSTSIEGTLYLSNPVTDFMGAGLYAEFAVGENELEFEQKLLLQKDWKNWTFAYNLIFETEIEGVFQDPDEPGAETEVEGVIAHALGASYAIGRGDLRIGGEMVIESVFENWSHYEDTSVYLGPVISYQGGKNWWVTVTPMYQLSSLEDEPDFNVRLIAGIEF